VVGFGEHVNIMPILDQLSEYQLPKKEKILIHEASLFDDVFSIRKIIQRRNELRWLLTIERKRRGRKRSDLKKKNTLSAKFWKDRSRDSSVRVAMDFGLDGRGLIPGRGIIFLFSAASRPTMGPIQPPVQWVLWAFSGGKAAGA
jgi:hypothetical protein